jgi:hypothetical protein
MNNKAQGMSTNTIILLVLGLIILAVLVTGFSLGWSNFSKYFDKANVDDISAQCQASCTMGRKYDYCTAPNKLIDVDKKEIITSCAVLAGESSFATYGVPSCPTIECNLPCENIEINGIKARKVSGNEQGTYDVSFLANDLASGEYCLI